MKGRPTPSRREVFGMGRDSTKVAMEATGSYIEWLGGAIHPLVRYASMPRDQLENHRDELAKRLAILRLDGHTGGCRLSVFYAAVTANLRGLDAATPNT